MAKQIDAQVYDQNVLAEGMQIQIDNYYQPVSAAQQRRIAVVIEALDPRAGERILDIGCGVGTFAFHSARRGAMTVGIDYSRESIKMATVLSKRFSRDFVGLFVTGSAFHLPFRSGYFDKIVAADFIEHITHEEKLLLLDEIFRVLKPGGSGVIFTPNALREAAGAGYWRIRNLVRGDRIPVTELHYGLICRKAFEAMLRKHNFSFQFRYEDTTRPYLADVPFLNRLLALNLLWIIKKQWPIKKS
jgi:ubiquinone/menaquinone biosynthesis C-methylase UbiE